MVGGQPRLNAQWTVWVKAIKIKHLKTYYSSCRFGHFPSDFPQDYDMYKVRYWMWRNIQEHVFEEKKFNSWNLE